MLRVVLRHRYITGIVTVATIACTVWLYQLLPWGAFPQQDTGMLSATTEGPQDISFPAMKDKQYELVKLVLSDPDVAHINANAPPRRGKPLLDEAEWAALKRICG